MSEVEVKGELVLGATWRCMYCLFRRHRCWLPVVEQMRRLPALHLEGGEDGQGVVSLALGVCGLALSVCGRV